MAFSIARHLNGVMAQMIGLPAHDFKVFGKDRSSFKLIETMGEFCVRLHVGCIPGYGQGRVLSFTAFHGMKRFPELRGCLGWAATDNELFSGPIRLTSSFANSCRYLIDMPYKDESDLERWREGLIRHVNDMLNSVPRVNNLEDLDLVLGPIHTDSLNDLLVEWVNGESWNCQESKVKMYPNSTLSVNYGPYAFALWKVIISKELDRDPIATRNWFQGLLDQGEPDFQLLPHDDEFKSKMKEYHAEIYPKIRSTFDKLVSQ